MTDHLTDTCKRVVELQAEYDAENLRTTGVIFMENHGGCGSPEWLAERKSILGAIDTSRTYAIWALARQLP
jgi:hypothetical protein